MAEWSKSHERILKEWKAKSFVNMWLQNASGYFYSSLHDFLSYPIIFVSSVSSIILLSSKENDVKYGLGALNMIIGVLHVIIRHIQPGELHQEYSSMARRYQLLIRKIDTCLDLPREMRKKPEAFIETIRADIETLSESHLYPPIRVIKKFEKKFGNLDEKIHGENIVELMKADMKNRIQVKSIMMENNVELQSACSNDTM